ncbi:unnamed protein product [Tetraodon nigroviridis]|uniref:(spotted green pufferfish) hypothetical protein n=1 Tax=Tetraodon nigroviridis TaxID=99883 RepID=Q4S3W4_TETNG|nr:unnamed protein product [Tetraodon nigroviridis]
MCDFGALIGDGVADSPARLRMSSLNHDVYSGLLVLIKFWALK